MSDEKILVRALSEQMPKKQIELAKEIYIELAKPYIQLATKIRSTQNYSLLLALDGSIEIVYSPTVQTQLDEINRQLEDCQKLSICRAKGIFLPHDDKISKI